MSTEVSTKTIVLKESVLSTLALTVNQNLHAISMIMKMDDEQMLEYISQMEQFGFIKEMMKSKPVTELIQDLEIKDLINENKMGIETHYEELMEAHEVLCKALEEN